MGPTTHEHRDSPLLCVRPFAHLCTHCPWVSCAHTHTHTHRRTLLAKVCAQTRVSVSVCVCVCVCVCVRARERAGMGLSSLVGRKVAVGLFFKLHTYIT